MKKLIILFIFSLNAFANYYLDLAIRPSANFNSNLDKLELKNNTINPSLGAELGANFGYITVGGGIELTMPLSFDGGTAGTTGEIQNMPYYAYGRLNVFPVVFKPYLVYKVGINKVYNYTGFGSGVEDGTFWAIGFGMDVYNFLGEVTYKNYQMDVNGKDENLSQFQISLGVKVF